MSNSLGFPAGSAPGNVRRIAARRIAARRIAKCCHFVVHSAQQYAHNSIAIASENK